MADDDVIARARAVLEKATKGHLAADTDGETALVRAVDAGEVLCWIEPWKPEVDAADARAIVLSRNAFEALLDVLEAVRPHYPARDYASGPCAAESCDVCKIWDALDRAESTLRTELDRVAPEVGR